MIRKISLFLAKILAICFLVILGLGFVLPYPAQAQTSVNATLTVISKDSQGAIVSGVTVYVYEQLADANGQPVLGKKLASGTVGATGSASIVVKVSNVSSISTAIVYYKNSYSKYTIWNQMLVESQTQNINLVLSSGRVVLKDQNAKLLTAQSFDLYASGIDANGVKVPTNSLQTYQKTGNLGYKIFYLAPGDYFIKAKNQPYPFTVLANKQTDVNIVINQNTPTGNTSPTSVYANVNLIAKDSGGNKATNVNYTIYKQVLDVNNQPVIGDKITSGKIGSTGSQTVKIKNTPNTALPLAIAFNVGSKEQEKFYLYNQSVAGGESKDIRLPISSVKITLKDANNVLLKDKAFDLYTVTKNASNVKTADVKIYSGIKTGTLGYKIYYLVPGDYAVRIRYSDSSAVNPADLMFSVSQDNQTNFTYSFNILSLTVIDRNGTYVSNKYFKIMVEEDKPDSDEEYKQVGIFKSDTNGLIKTYLPAGSYQVYAKKNNGNYELVYEFTLSSGVNKELTYRLGSFILKVENAYADPLALQRVTIYNYKNGLKQTKVFSGQTNNSGELELNLLQGNYIAEITNAGNSFIFSTAPFYISEDANLTYEYKLSLARIYLQNNQDVNLSNQSFTIYDYATDSKGNVEVGAKLISLATNTGGYSEIYLPAKRYIVKIGSQPEIYPIVIENSKINTLYVSTRSGVIVQPVPALVPANPQPVNPADLAPLNVYTNENLYNKDSDGDTLSDFEETYIWLTNPYKADSDGDGFNDNVEIPAGFDPNGPGRKTYTVWAYNKPRVSDLRVEIAEAAYLKAQLGKRIGTYQLSDQDWNTIIKSFVYGGYTISEIQDTIVYGPGMVHPTIPAYIWRRINK